MLRIKTRAQFQTVLGGARVAYTPHFALHSIDLDKTSSQNARAAIATNQLPLFGVSDVWIGAMVPKRWAKRAVTRNTIKRQIYTVCQKMAPALPLAAHVLRLRQSFDSVQFKSATSATLKRALRGEIEQLLRMGIKVWAGAAT